MEFLGNNTLVQPLFIPCLLNTLTSTSAEMSGIEELCDVEPTLVISLDAGCGGFWSTMQS